MRIPEIRRKIGELTALYSLEPLLRDIYVESSADAQLLRWFFHEKGSTNVYVYSINMVEIPDSVLEARDLRGHSERNRVLLLARELSGHFKDGVTHVKCIVDTDYDQHLGRCEANAILEYTDYTSMEMYFFSTQVIEKFLTLTIRGFPLSAKTVMKELKKVAQRLFLIRLTNEHLGWAMSWLDMSRFSRYLSWNPRSVRFEEDRFIRAYLLKNSRMADMDEFQGVLGEFEGNLDSDARHNMRGHDFTHVFLLIVKHFKERRAGFRDLGTFEGALCGCLELAFIDSEPLFAILGGG